MKNGQGEEQAPVSGPFLCVGVVLGMIVGVVGLGVTKIAENSPQYF
jgi:hypothetical protein